MAKRSPIDPSMPEMPLPRRSRDFIKTPLMRMALGGHGAALELTEAPGPLLMLALRSLFFSAGPTFVGSAPLHIAVVRNTVEADLLTPAALQQRSLGHQTALGLAAMVGNAAATALLLQRGVSPDDGDAFGNTPLHWAMATDNFDIADRLRAAGATSDGVNLFRATPDDYKRTRCDSGGTSEAAAETFYVHSQGSQPLQTWSLAQLERHLGMTYVSQTRLHNDFFLQVGMLPALHAQSVEQVLSWQHVEDVAERMSSADIPNASKLFLKYLGQPFGWGVFARELIPYGTLIGSYTGDVVHRTMLTAEGNRGEDSAYLSPIALDEKNLLACAVDARWAGNCMSRVNGSADGSAVNVETVPRWRHGLPSTDFLAARPIAAYEQIITHYGDAYWQTLGVSPVVMPGAFLRLPTLPA